MRIVRLMIRDEQTMQTNGLWLGGKAVVNVLTGISTRRNFVGHHYGNIWFHFVIAVLRSGV